MTLGRVKYPPAEPGALRFEPLEAAVAASHVTLIGLIASPQHWKQPLLAPSRALTNRTSFAPCFASAACVHLPIKARERSRCTRSRSGRPTPGNVKLPLPPRQSRGNSRYISGWLREQPVPIPKLTPRPYQIEALTRISETLSRVDRAHVVMACGTGKTLVALWAAEAIKPKTVLVLLPSLTLLQQTVDEWSRHNSWGKAFTYLCVCSDPTVATRDANDPIRLDATDLEFRVDTSPDEVRCFMERDTPGVKIVFSTYQSSPVVSDGIRGLAPFDVAIFDEAHKTTGPQGGLFAHGLKDENIRTRKRLFLTATPRHYDIRHRDKEGDFRIVSMSEEAIYGPRAYTLTFGSAARQGFICNYKVVISVVDGQEVNEFALKHGITLVEGDPIGTRWVANQIAIARAIEKTEARRAITFHSRVSSAKEFGTEGTHGIKQFLPDFSVFHINGEQKSSQRKQLIRLFRDAAKGLVTNARCLTEGIDVPVVDMVAFIDPRHSRVDIAQATGRAMRKPHGSDKDIGYVVIPLFLQRKNGETLAEALDRSDFADVANVLNTMQEQDEDLVQIIRELRVKKGRGETFDPRILSDKIEVIGPSIDLSTLRSNVFAEVVDAIGSSWDEWCGRLTLYKDRKGHCRVPQRHSENGFPLGAWVNYQRLNYLSQERRQRLDALGFVWDAQEEAWEEGFRQLTVYLEREGHCRVPIRHKENGFRLGQWVSVQRLKENLSAQRRQKLDRLGFTWDPRDTEWEEGVSHLKAYKEREGHCRVPYSHVESGFRLGLWVVNRRAEAKSIPIIRRQQLDQLGFVWDPFGADWEEGFRYLTMYKEREGHCRVSAKHHEDSFPLGTWISKQRSTKDTLLADRRRRLDELEFIWDPFAADWDEASSYLKTYKEREGHCRVPYNHIENGFKLGKWITRQRTRMDLIPDGRRQRLEELGFHWDAREAAWETGFSYLEAYKGREGHCRVPPDQKEHGFRLGQWVGTQRANKENLSEERLPRLDEIAFVWDPRASDWDEAFRYLRAYKEREGHCRVPYNHVENGFRLGGWATKQRSKRHILSQDRRKRLHELGFVWDAREVVSDAMRASPSSTRGDAA